MKTGNQQHVFYRAEVDIDQSLISKFEKNERKPTMDWYSEKIADELKYTESTSEILKVAEEKIKYYKTQANGK